MTTRDDSEDDPVEREPPKREVAYSVGQEAASTMLFFPLMGFPKAEEYKFALCLLQARRNSRNNPQSLETKYSS